MEQNGIKQYMNERQARHAREKILKIGSRRKLQILMTTMMMKDIERLYACPCLLIICETKLFGCFITLRVIRKNRALAHQEGHAVTQRSVNTKRGRSPELCAKKSDGGYVDGGGGGSGGSGGTALTAVSLSKRKLTHIAFKMRPTQFVTFCEEVDDICCRCRNVVGRCCGPFKVRCYAESGEIASFDSQTEKLNVKVTLRIVRKLKTALKLN